MSVIIAVGEVIVAVIVGMGWYLIHSKLADLVELTDQVVKGNYKNLEVMKRLEAVWEPSPPLKEAPKAVDKQAPRVVADLDEATGQPVYNVLKLADHAWVPCLNNNRVSGHPYDTRKEAAIAAIRLALNHPGGAVVARGVDLASRNKKRHRRTNAQILADRAEGRK